MKEIMKQIQAEVSQKRLYQSVKEVSNFHRIQASTGFREAASFVCKKINDMGIEAKLLTFTANDNTWYLQQKMFQEWTCKNAWLEVEGLGRIADFQEEAISIVQKSYPCDYSQTPLDVVLVEDTSPRALENLDLEGKLVFIHTMPTPHLETLIKEKKAVGFITDFMREVPPVRMRQDAYDTLNYTSFWWKDGQPRTFGFVLSPRVGDRLKDLCLKTKAAYEKDPNLSPYPKATCKVESMLYPGELEVVEAVLPGKSREEIIISAHLCHPRSSANDNASGVAGGMEALRVLKQLTETGKIPALNKTVRLILMPEMTGTYCYLSTLKDYNHIKGAINLDMIGGKQNGSYGPITITATHHALQSPVTSIASMVLKYARYQAKAFQGDDVPLVNSVIEGYTGGSDHTIYSDPTINVPCIMLGQWPDKYYHTSSDTLECVDPLVLAFSTSFAAGYVYALSNFDEAMHKETMTHHLRLMIKDLEALVPSMDGARAKHIVNYYKKSVKNFRVYGPVDVSEDRELVNQVGKATAVYLGFKKPKKAMTDPQYDYVPERHFVGPIDDLNAYVSEGDWAKAAIKQYDEVAKPYGFKAMMMTAYVLNYMDGKRSLNKIYREILMETGEADIKLMDAYVRALKELGLVSFKEKNQGGITYADFD